MTGMERWGIPITILILASTNSTKFSTSSSNPLYHPHIHFQRTKKTNELVVCGRANGKSCLAKQLSRERTEKIVGCVSILRVVRRLSVYRANTNFIDLA